MNRLLLIFSLCAAATAAQAAPYWGVAVSTGAGTATAALAGTLKVYASTAAASPVIAVSGKTGKITAASAALSGTLTVSSTTEVQTAVLYSTMNVYGSLRFEDYAVTHPSAFKIDLSTAYNAMRIGNNVWGGQWGNSAWANISGAKIDLGNGAAESQTYTTMANLTNAAAAQQFTSRLAAGNTTADVFRWNASKNGITTDTALFGMNNSYNVYARYGLSAASMTVTGGAISINGLDYSMPSARGAAATVLSENGSGGLYWQSMGALSNPPGTVITFVSSACPGGYLTADGTSVSTAAYANLFSVMGYTFGGSGGSFNLPDLRGYFVRGYDSGAGRDSGRAFASVQTDAFQGHYHANNPDSATQYINYAGGGTQGWSGGGNYQGGIYSLTTTGAPAPDTANGTPRTAAETRPKNIALQYCVKY